MASLRGDASLADRARLAEEIAEEIASLKSDYRRVLARQADEDYSRRRAEWRAQQAERGANCRRSGASACA